MFPAQTWLCPAKLNLRLFIQGKRPDGYHELALDFIPINLFDELSLRPGNGITLDPALGIAPEQNLVYRAALALAQATQCHQGANLSLKKHIPLGAGLGGGSSDAACTLAALNRLWGLGLRLDELQPLAQALGADVPFFLNPQPSLGRGIGEQLTPTPLPQTLYYLLLKPSLHVSTQEAYQLAQHSRRNLTPGDFTPAVLSQIRPSDNDFFIPLSERHPELGRLAEALAALEPDGYGYSGSGSCLFAQFFEQKKRDQAFERLGPLQDCQVHRVQSLDQWTWNPLKLQQ